MLTLNAYAKINLTLDITGRREDGYHTICMVMQSISLCDELTIILRQDAKIKLTCSNPNLVVDESNIVQRAAKLFFTLTNNQKMGATIDLQKNIPIAAGLAGGSTDAATTLIALNELTETGLTKNQLMQIGLMLGADVPFCIMGGTALAEGIGEVLTPLKAIPECYIVLAKPKPGISTASAYANFDKYGAKKHPITDIVISAINSGDLVGMTKGMHNVLEDVAGLPIISELEAIMLKHGAIFSQMSGSGPTVFGLFEDEVMAVKAVDDLKNRLNHFDVTVILTSAKK
jgi:4-diphosphocytidyl-2-C-methyl-D-erythritol kinase